MAALNPGFDLSELADGNLLSMMTKLRERVAYDEPLTALLICGGITIALMAYGASRLGRRDFPLKD